MRPRLSLSLSLSLALAEGPLSPLRPPSLASPPPAQKGAISDDPFDRRLSHGLGSDRKIGLPQPLRGLVGETKAGREASAVGSAYHGGLELLVPSFCHPRAHVLDDGRCLLGSQSESSGADKGVGNSGSPAFRADTQHQSPLQADLWLGKSISSKLRYAWLQNMVPQACLSVAMSP